MQAAVWKEHSQKIGRSLATHDAEDQETVHVENVLHNVVSTTGKTRTMPMTKTKGWLASYLFQTRFSKTKWICNYAMMHKSEFLTSKLSILVASLADFAHAASLLGSARL